MKTRILLLVALSFFLSQRSFAIMDADCCYPPDKNRMEECLVEQNYNTGEWSSNRPGAQCGFSPLGRKARIIEYTFQVGGANLILKEYPEPLDLQTKTFILLDLVDKDNKTPNTKLDFQLIVDGVEVDSASNDDGKGNFRNHVVLELKPSSSSHFPDGKISFIIKYTEEKKTEAPPAAPDPKTVTKSATASVAGATVPDPQTLASTTVSEHKTDAAAVYLNERIYFDLRGALAYNDLSIRSFDGAVFIKLYLTPIDKESNRHYFLLGPEWENSWRGTGLILGASIIYPEQLMYVGISYPLLPGLDIFTGTDMFNPQKAKGDDYGDGPVEYHFTAGASVEISSFGGYISQIITKP